MNPKLYSSILFLYLSIKQRSCVNYAELWYSLFPNVIASLIVRVHRKYLFCLKFSASCIQSQNNIINFEFNKDLNNSLPMHGHMTF